MYIYSACSVMNETAAHPSFANLQNISSRVYHGGVGPACPYEADPGGVGCQLHGSLRGHGVTGVEHSRARDTAEHRQVLQGHLRGAVLSWKGQQTTFTNQFINNCLLMKRTKIYIFTKLIKNHFHLEWTTNDF